MLRPLPRLVTVAAFVCIACGGPSLAQSDTSVLRANIESLKADNATLEKLVDYAETLVSLANDDPASARRARAPFERCEATPLRRYCPVLRGLFKVETQ